MVGAHSVVGGVLGGPFFGWGANFSNPMISGSFPQMK